MPMMRVHDDSIDAVAEIVPLTDEARRRFPIYIDLLRRWQRAQNLVAPSTLPEVWRRHVADSAQALAAWPQARRWLDLGAGAGFPGLVTAILLADEPDARVDLVESNLGKAAFLRTVARETGAPAFVHSERIEAAVPRFTGNIEAVSARALAGLPRLLGLAAPVLEAGAVGVFHKGRDFPVEVNEALRDWAFNLVEHPSRIEPGGRIALIRDVAPRSPSRGNRQ